MEEQFLQEVGQVLVGWVKDRIKNKKFERLNKIGGTIPPSPRKIYGSGNLERSVEVRIEDGDILILMNDYGADILFGEGRREQPEFKSGRKIDIVGIPPVNKIRDWMKTVPSFRGLSQKKMEGISFGIAINIAKRGIGALDLFREEQFEDEVNQTIEEMIDTLIQREDYKGLGLDIDEVIDKIILLSTDSFELIEE